MIIRVEAIPQTPDASAWVVHAYPENRIYVDFGAPAGGMGKTWADAINNADGLCRALALANVLQIHEIWVAQGTYAANGENGIALQSDVAIFGSFEAGQTSLSERDLVAHPSIISGGNDVSVVLNAYGIKNARLNGFTVTGSAATVGIYCSYVASDVVIEDCTVSDTGGSGFELCYYGSPWIRNCTISGNTLDGVFVDVGSNPRITGCQITGNRRAGIWCAVYTYNSWFWEPGDASSAEIDDSVICANVRDGVVCSDRSKIKISKSVITGNGSEKDALYPVTGNVNTFDASSMAIDNCVIAKGHSYGGLVRSGTILNCTIADNGGTGIDASSGTGEPAEVGNCILANNAGSGIVTNPYAPTSVTESCLFYANARFDYDDGTPEGQCVGSAEIAGVLGVAAGNMDGAPSFAPSITGEWAEVSRQGDNFVLRATTPAFASQNLAGHRIKVDVSREELMRIVSNTPDTVILCTNDVRFAISPGAGFETDGFHLRNGSDAIDRGRESVAPPEDIDGEARPRGSGVDIGADEAPPECVAPPHAYLTEVPAVSITGEICMHYHIEPGSAPVVSLDLWYRKNGAEWQLYGTFVDLGAPVCFDASATGDGTYEFCLVAGGTDGSHEVLQSFAEAHTTVATSFPDGRIYVNNRAAEGLGTGTSWENAFLSISDGILAAQLAGIAEVWVAGGAYSEKITIPSGVKLQGGYNPGNSARTWKTILCPDPRIPVMVGGNDSLLEVLDTAPPTVTMTGTENAELSGFTLYPSRFQIFGTVQRHYDIVLKATNVGPSTLVSDCVFAGYLFNYDSWSGFDTTCGIRCTDASPILEDCTFSQFQRGVEVNGSSAPIMNNCCWDQGCMYGLNVNDEAHPVLDHCTFESSVYVLDRSRIDISDSNINAGTFILRGQSLGTIARCIFQKSTKGEEYPSWGMRVEDSACVDISDSIFTALDTGIDIASNNGANLITNCAFQGMATVGIYCNTGAYARFQNCVIAGNGLSSTRGVAISCHGCSPAFLNCTIADNAGIAVEIGPPDYYRQEIHPAFQNCIISDQHGSGGAGISCYRNVNVADFTPDEPVLKSGLPILTNCLFYGNDGGDLLVYEGGMANKTRVYEAADVNEVTGSTTTVSGDPKFVRGLSGAWDSISWVADKELALEAAGPYVEAGDLAGRFLVANDKYARQLRILRSSENIYTNRNVIDIRNETGYILARGDRNQAITIGSFTYDSTKQPSVEYHGDGVRARDGEHPGDSFHVVDYHLQDGSMAVDGADVSLAPGADADGNTRPSGEGAQVSIGAYEAPASYVIGPNKPYTRVTELEGMEDGVLVGLQFDVGFVAHSIAANPVASVELWRQFNGGEPTLYGSTGSTETSIRFSATEPGMYGFYTIGVAADGTREDPPLVPDATCEVAAPWDGATPICVASDASADEGRKKTGLGWGNAFQKLSNAIERARVYKTGEIWVKQGTYDHITMISNLAIYGGFIGTETERAQRNATLNPTTIGTGEIYWVGNALDGNSTPLSVRYNGTQNTLLDGLTLIRGVYICQCNDSNAIRNCTIGNFVNDPVSTVDSSPKFSGCSITSYSGTYLTSMYDNPSTVAGAWSGISVYGGAPSFTDCQVDGVFWNAVYADVGAVPTFTDCRIFSQQPDSSDNACYQSDGALGNTMKSVASCFCSAAPVFQSCTITGCAEAGVYVSQWPDGGCTDTEVTQNLAPVFDDCVISVSGMTPWMSHRRREGYGIVCLEAATTPQFSRCRIQGNFVGVYAHDSRADFSNCIIADNGRSYVDGDYSYLEGAGIFCDGSPASTFLNCTISDNPNVAVEADGLEVPSLINCIITGTDGTEAVRNRCQNKPALQSCFFNNSQADYGAYDLQGVLKTAARGTAELAKLPGITAPVDGAPHFLPSVEIGWWGDVPESVRENGYRTLDMAKTGTYTQFTAPAGSFGTENLAGKFIFAVSNDGGLYAKSGLIVANTGSTIDVLGDFTERPPANLHVVIPNYHIDNGSRALWHGTVEDAPTCDIDGEPRPGSDTWVDIGADEGAPGSRPGDVYLLHLLCPHGGQISPQAGTSFHEAGTTVSLGASDTTDRGFVRWEEVDTAGQVIAEHGQREIQVQMDTDRTFRAVFGARVSITVGKSGVGATDPLVGTYSYLEFTQATFAASPVEGSQFARWEDANGMVLGTGPVLSFTVTESATVRAVFAETGTVCASPLP